MAGPLNLPGDFPTVPSAVYDDLKLIRLAREVAMGIKPLEDVLTNHDISIVEFEKLKGNPRFLHLFSSEVQAWESAINTQERVKLKSASLLEEWLPELYARMNDRTESLSAKIEGGKLVRDLGGLGGKFNVDGAAPGDRVSITINLGADVKLQYSREAPVIIDGVVNAPEPKEPA